MIYAAFLRKRVDVMCRCSKLCRDFVYAWISAKKKDGGKEEHRMRDQLLDRE